MYFVEINLYSEVFFTCVLQFAIGIFVSRFEMTKNYLRTELFCALTIIYLTLGLKPNIYIDKNEKL